MSRNEREVTLFVQNWPTTLAHNGVTLLLFGALFAPGLWLDSAAMQWTAGIMWFLCIFGVAHSYASKNRGTIAEIRKRLDELEAEGF